MIGITERGDAGLDLSWADRLNEVDGAILITKHVTSPKFLELALKHQNKIIVHATVTGYGSTVLEPGVPPADTSISCLNTFADFFPPERLVLRVDPIIPTNIGIGKAYYVMSKVTRKIKRIRFSFIDQYTHVRQRMTRVGVPLPWNTFHAPQDVQACAIDAISRNVEKAFGAEVEICGEANSIIPSHWRIGCVSQKDIDILGIKNQQPINLSGQRKACLCIAAKKELLNNRKQCPSGCLYCYWK